MRRRLRLVFFCGTFTDPPHVDLHSLAQYTKPMMTSLGAKIDNDLSSFINKAAKVWTPKSYYEIDSLYFYRIPYVTDLICLEFLILITASCSAKINFLVDFRKKKKRYG